MKRITAPAKKLKALEPNNESLVAGRLAKHPPWEGTPAEELLRELVPEQWYAVIWGEVAAIVRDSRRADALTGEELLQLTRIEKLYGVEVEQEPPPRTPHARAEWLRRKAARYRAQAQRLEYGRPPQPEKAKELRAVAAMLEANHSVEKKNLPPAPKGNRAEKPERWRIVRLLKDVREVTGKPHHEAVAALLTLAGYETTADALKMIEQRKKAKSNG